MSIRAEHLDALDLEALWMARREAQFYLSEYDRSVAYWSDHKERIANADAILRGDFAYRTTDENGNTVTVVEAPMVANVVQLALEDRAATASSIAPTVRCKARNARGVERAKKRERIAQAYLEANEFTSVSVHFFIDYLLCGVSYKGVFPDFATRMPCVRRFDPRFSFPNRRFTPGRPMENFIVAYQEQLGVLMEEYPDAAWPSYNWDQVNRAELITCIEWFDGIEFCRYAMTHYNSERIGLKLTPTIPNLLDELPIIASVRPTGDNQIRGVYDQTLYPLLAENQMTKVVLEHAEDWLESPMVAHDIENAEETGVVYRAKSKDGFMRRMPPDGGNTQIFGVLERMRGASRMAAVSPDARQGSVEQNIASAAFVGAIQASFSTGVDQDRRIEARSWSKVLSLCFKTDEMFFPEEKWISGTHKGVAFDEKYNPAEDIKGDHQSKLSYPLAGATQFEADIRLVQAAKNKIIPLRRARELSSFSEDVLEDETQIIRETLLDAGLQFIAAAAAGASGSVPNFEPAVALLDAIDKPNTDIMKVLRQFGQFQLAVAQPPGQQKSALEEASSLARGGLPSPALNVPGVGAPTAGLMPSLGELGIPNAPPPGEE